MKIISNLRKRIVKSFFSKKYIVLININTRANNFIILVGSFVTNSVLPRVVVDSNPA